MVDSPGLNNKQKSANHPSTISHDETHEDALYRITKRELLRRHRAHPVLIESLLLAAKAMQKTEKLSGGTSICMEFILSLTKFQQKTKWLLPWGTEVTDITNRSPDCAAPDAYLKDMYLRIIEEPDCKNQLSKDAITEYLKDFKQHFDGIILPFHEPSHFTLLHLHPCEELILKFEEKSLSLEDMTNIAKCKNLRSLSLNCNKISKNSMKQIQRLPNLAHVYHDHMDREMVFVQEVCHIPSVSMLTITELNVMEEADIQAIVSLVNTRRDRISHVYLSCTLPATLADALGRCTNLKSIFFEDYFGASDVHVQALLSSPSVQRSLQSIRVLYTHSIGADAFALMAKCANLRWLLLEGLHITAADIIPIIQANAHHMSSVICRSCQSIDSSILDAIACCRSLHYADLDRTGVTAEAMQEYRAAKRPNWEVISHNER